MVPIIGRLTGKLRAYSSYIFLCSFVYFIIFAISIILIILLLKICVCPFETGYLVQEGLMGRAKGGTFPKKCLTILLIGIFGQEANIISF